MATDERGFARSVCEEAHRVLKVDFLAFVSTPTKAIKLQASAGSDPYVAEHLTVQCLFD